MPPRLHSVAARPVDASVMSQVWAHLHNRDQRPRPPRPEDRLRIAVDATAGTAELCIYDEIGLWGITATDVVEMLRPIQANTIEVRINSPGGDVFDGVAIYNALRGHPATINVVVDGLAASAASFIAQAGDRVTMNLATQLMIHDALGLTIGNASDHQTMVELLNRVSDSIASIYADRAGGTVPEWRERMRAETWYSPEEAVEAGLADAQVTEEAADEADEHPVAASFDLATTRFLYAGRQQAPAPELAAALAVTAEPPTPVETPLDVEAITRALKGAFA